MSGKYRLILSGETLGLFDSQEDSGRFYPDSGVSRGDMIDLIDRLVTLYR